MRRVRLTSLVGLSVCFACWATYAQAQAGAYLANPSVRLWYEETGKLSENLATSPNFTLWNTIIGEGDAEEQADEALFTVDLRTDGQQNIVQPLVLTATDAGGKVLGKRTFANLLTGEAGNLALPLWVEDIGCAGRVTFKAQFGADVRSVVLDFNCGE